MINTDNPILRQTLQKEIPIHTSEIQDLYRMLDKKFELHAADVPISFGFDTAQLGSYTRASRDYNEQFRFSLFFIGYSMKKPLSKADRMDLYKHEYAHYMQYHYDIPKEYLWQTGTHGSAWKYCCSLVGCAPSPFYSFGQGEVKHDYKKPLTNPMKDKYAGTKDIYRRKQTAQKTQDSIPKYAVGDLVTHPSFGEGEILEVIPRTGSVHLKIRFQNDSTKTIDQKWLIRKNHKKQDSK